MKILKFGGSSVGNAEAINKVVEIVKNRLKHGEDIIVVTSAFQHMTDKLIDMAKKASNKDESYREIFLNVREKHMRVADEVISLQTRSAVVASLLERFNELEEILRGVFALREISPRSMDLIMSFGERLAAYILSEALKSNKTPAEFVDSRELIKTDENFGSANVIFGQTDELIRNYFIDGKDNCKIVTGFLGSTTNGETSTLGRGGSDYSASILGAALNAEIIEIWTDVDGIFTADPKKVKNASPLKYMLYSEARELSHFGAKVIYPPTMQPALLKNIPILIKNTFNPDAAGTLISYRPEQSAGPSHQVPGGLSFSAEKHDSLVTGISSINKISMLRVEGSGMIGIAGIAMRVFKALASRKINIILISQASSEQNICIAILPQYVEPASFALEEEFQLEMERRQIGKIIVENDLSCIAAIGENMRAMPGISGRLFAALGKNGINIKAIAQGSSELNISVIIEAKDEEKALNAVHDCFFYSYFRPVNLFLVGVGLVGGTLVEQINQQKEILHKEHGIDLRICAYANSKKMIFADDENFLQVSKEKLENSSEAFSPSGFIQKMRLKNLPNSVFVDSTANEEITNFYEEILNSSVSIVTPNKKANSGPFNKYKKLKETAKLRSVKFLYETNVGGGLPIISTLKHLVLSGDEIKKIEGVFSGTLSYLFNSFDGKSPFSVLISEAMKMGYTEPDPRDDLCGIDVGRKLLILIRELGFKYELTDIVVENLVPENMRNCAGAKEFLAKLPEMDQYFEEKRISAENEGKVLRYIASFEDGRANVSLKTVDKNHPAYSLTGGENIVAFTTKRYFKNPLVIKGPGAGPHVTAAGVFADILKATHHLF